MLAEDPHTVVRVVWSKSHRYRQNKKNVTFRLTPTLTLCLIRLIQHETACEINARICDQIGLPYMYFNALLMLQLHAIASYDDNTRSVRNTASKLSYTTQQQTFCP
jgi:hypothetical protein